MLHFQNISDLVVRKLINKNLGYWTDKKWKRKNIERFFKVHKKVTGVGFEPTFLDPKPSVLPVRRSRNIVEILGIEPRSQAFQTCATPTQLYLQSTGGRS